MKKKAKHDYSSGQQFFRRGATGGANRQEELLAGKSVSPHFRFIRTWRFCNQTYEFIRYFNSSSGNLRATKERWKMVEFDPRLQWKEPQDYPLSLEEGKPARHFPPCPNGCGNESILPIKKIPRPGLEAFEGMREDDTRTRFYFFFCEQCMSFFYIKIQELEKEAAEAAPHQHN